LIEHPQQGVPTPLPEPLVAVLKKVVEHPADYSSAINRPMLLIRGVRSPVPDLLLSTP
jgi:hypothetical protein